MSEEFLQRDLIKNPGKIGTWNYYEIGSTTVNQLKKADIIRSIDYGNVSGKKVDAIIIKQKEVIAIVEYKLPKEFNTKEKRDKAILQEIDVARKLKTKLIIATDKQKTIWVNVATGNHVKDKEGNDLKYSFEPQDENLQKFITEIIQSINEKNDRILPKELIDPTGLAKQIWQDIWSVSGATPENCLYTFVELFIFKYLSDLRILQDEYSFDELINKNNILDYYARFIRPKIKKLFPENPIDKTTIINGTIFVSKDQEAVLGYDTVFRKVLNRFKDYGKLEHIDHDFKSKLFESFLKESISKKNWGQFFTPIKIVRAINDMARISAKDMEGMKICDPACGVGKFPLEFIKENIEQFFKLENGKITQKVKIVGFDKGFDHDEQKTIILAKANMLIYFCELIKDNPEYTEQFAQIFNDSFILKTNSILGTLSEPIENKYDYILTNPPYVTSGSSNLKEEISKKTILKNYYTVNAMGVEGLFMEWIVKALKKGGKAFIVIPDGVLNRQNDKNIRQYILDTCYIDAIISLPLNTFFTTNKKTYILAITKKNDISEIQTDPVFTYLVSEIGETRDINRFDIEENDLKEGIILFNQFKGAKAYFYTGDKRCKIHKIDKFIGGVEEDWVIDKWWSREERVSLGIEKKENIVSMFEFSSILGEVSSSINSFELEVKELLKQKTDKDINSFVLQDLFDIERGLAKYTKKYGDENKGEYPVYSASNQLPLTNINTFDFDGEYLTWATNGFAGYIKIISGKFSINGDRALLKSKNDNINLKYIKHILEPILRNLAKGRKGEQGSDEFTKVYPSMLHNIKITLPITEGGLIDISVQNELVKKINVIEEIQERILQNKEEMQELKVAIGLQEFKLIKIKDIFEVKKGLSKYTNVFIKKNPGQYPLYSSQTINKGLIGMINTYDYDCKCITWTTDGIYAGTVFLRVGKFAMTTHCGALILKKNNLNLNYVYSFLSEDLKNYAMGEQNKRVTVDIIQNVQIKIPIKETGEFDLQKQKEIAEKYRKIEEIKGAIKVELEKIENVKVDIGL